ncbi:hypothetical protein DOTSEDRAFT_24993 [Dothistroma septosporum NZE10]|uniref:Uncharacterized protein n=1 Tax=Dothistroma septosporum (strain NZE10 / CBS 128990) TaxID=675120 RepID=M2XKI0_DOTSN|nr:hypothetical protein DOTSEDRAFT_24993 [Dothistroma septosporum NZE10]
MTSNMDTTVPALYETLKTKPCDFLPAQICSSADDWNRHLPMQISLKTLSFEDAPKYRCLCSLWVLDEQHSITINALELPITKNLLGFLRVMRFKPPDGEYCSG